MQLRFTIPAANLDDTTPAAVDRVDVYAVSVAPDAEAAPSAGQIVSDPRNLRTRIAVRRLEPEQPPPAGTVTLPAPGDPAVVLDVPPVSDAAAPASMHYVVVPVSGTGRGRPGPPSAAAIVPFGPLPAAPGDVTLTHDETTLKITWNAGAEGQVFKVVRTTPPASDGQPLPLTPEPLSAAETSVPVVFGEPFCATVSAAVVAGGVSVQGPPSTPQCITPVDRYAPPAPAGLRAVQEGTTVTLIWDAVTARDLAGYIVLRGDGVNENLQPLMRAPVSGTTYRDTTVATGATYVYAVYAVDTAPAANVSELSARQTVTVR